MESSSAPPNNGVELSQFVHPSHVSKNFICPITQCVLPHKGAVITPCEHLFCEDALLEWLLRSSKCPVCNTTLNPEQITKPNRVIVNMLSELQRYCPNRSRGCLWTGPNEAVAHHLGSCTHKREESMEFLKTLVEQLKAENRTLREESMKKDEEMGTLRRKLQVLELSLAPHVPPNFFRPFDPDQNGSTSEGDSDDVGGDQLSNTDNDGDISSIGTVHRRRTTSRHDRSSRRHKKSSNRESHDNDVRRIAGLRDAKERMGRRKEGGSGAKEEERKHASESDGGAPLGRRRKEDMEANDDVSRAQQESDSDDNPSRVVAL